NEPKRGRWPGARLAELSPDGRRLVTRQRDDKPTACTVWDVDTGAAVATLATQDDYVAIVRFSPDGSKVLTATLAAFAPGGVRVWDAATGAELARLPVDKGSIQAAAFSPDGRQVAAAVSGQGRIWDAASGKELVRFDAKSTVNALRFSP